MQNGTFVQFAQFENSQQFLSKKSLNAQLYGVKNRDENKRFFNW